jgi:hypothetical protein
MPACFATLSEARDTLNYHWHDYIYFAAKFPKPMTAEDADLAKQQGAKYSILFMQWSFAFDAFVAMRGNTLSENERKGVMVLEIEKRIAYTSLSMPDNAVDDQTLWDDFLPIFEQIVSLAESISGIDLSAKEVYQSKPSFSLDFGIVGPLYDVAARCRDPVIRRRAIAVLRATARQEGIWDGALVAHVADRVVEIEESGLGLVTNCKDVPDWARISEVIPVFDKEARSGLLSYRRLSSPAERTRETVVEILDW